MFVPVQVFVFVFDGDGDDCNNDTPRTCAASMYHCLHEFVHLAHARYPLILYLYFHLYFCGEKSYDSLTYHDTITFNKQSLTPFYQNIGSYCLLGFVSIFVSVNVSVNVLLVIY